jgi:hypothetical protein
MAKDTPKTPAQYEEMRAELNQYDAAVEEAKRVAKEAFFAPIKTALDNDCGRALYRALEPLRNAFDGDEYPENANLRIHLDGIVSILPYLYAAAGVELTVPTETAPEATTEASTEA